MNALSLFLFCITTWQIYTRFTDAVLLILPLFCGLFRATSAAWSFITCCRYITCCTTSLFCYTLINFRVKSKFYSMSSGNFLKGFTLSLKFLVKQSFTSILFSNHTYLITCLLEGGMFFVILVPLPMMFPLATLAFPSLFTEQLLN